MPRSPFDVHKAKWVKNDDVYMKDSRQDDIVIPVMGAMGGGKSTFINNCLSHFGTNGPLAPTSAGFHPGTSKVAHYTATYLTTGRRLVLVDTPGFDHGQLEAAEVLRRIAVWLSASYSDGVTVAGVVYIYDVASIRYTKGHELCMDLFEKLCGCDSLSGVMVATTRVGTIPDGLEPVQEQELRNEWKSLLEGHPCAEMFHLENSTSSAASLVGRILERQSNGVLLQLQRQIVDDNKSVDKTEAGRLVKQGSGDQWFKVWKKWYSKVLDRS
ncbi:hypothetical protein D9611_009878 [Ephemerocybe angulata]|uniref:G domain-containing protein n=1 Tax=Ephemerocybe angulata TaxID=980116 RepID=A0A8H5CEJ6_9AGAR|nr:hypothetical protein D9611_009878 [Tulosesus angulatus]